MTPRQWIEQTNAIGIVSKQGRYGGTYAHKDIAFEHLPPERLAADILEKERRIAEIVGSIRELLKGGTT